MTVTPPAQASRPSALRITDMRVAKLKGMPFRSALLRLDTNQGLSGYGEIRDGASASYALMLKSRLVGQNPCDIERLFRRIEQFGGHARQGGGVSGVTMALCDLAGKAYGVPAYMLAGGRFRDAVLVYADTASLPHAEDMGRSLQRRMAMGYRFLKMDLGIDLLEANGVQEGLSFPPAMRASTAVMHPFTGIRLAPRGIDALAAYVDAVRAVVGYEVPLALDHFGHIGVESGIQLGRALAPFALAWLEDLIPWQLTDQWLHLTRSLTTPTCTGEDIYLRRHFEPLIARRAVSVIHPDLATAGGIHETKRIGDRAQEMGMPMALHAAGSPVAFLASVHCAAATENFFVLENHAVDVAAWDDLLEGIDKPLVRNGYAPVPEGPGLGFESLNPDALEAHLDDDEPLTFDMDTSAWDHERSHDRLWS